MRRPRMEDRPTTLNRAERPKRTPINGYRNRLQITGEEPGFHYCWINDYNVDRYLEAGYDYVTHDVMVGHKKIDVTSQPGSRITQNVGNGVVAYLMRCPDDIYHDEMDSLEADLQEKEQAMRQQSNEGQYGQVKIGRGDPSKY